MTVHVFLSSVREKTLKIFLIFQPVLLEPSANHAMKNATVKIQTVVITSPGSVIAILVGEETSVNARACLVTLEDIA